MLPNQCHSNTKVPRSVFVRCSGKQRQQYGTKTPDVSIKKTHHLTMLSHTLGNSNKVEKRFLE